MRRALLMVGLLAVVVFAAYGGPRLASATQTCTENCTGGTLTCTSASGTCSSASGSVTCCGAVHTCTAINAYTPCANNCNTAFLMCEEELCGPCLSPLCRPNPGCVGECELRRSTCLRSCGQVPPTSFSC